MIITRPTAKMGMAITNMGARWELIWKAINKAKINMIGQRTATRMDIMYAFWILVISVVRRVTILAVENLSMLEKEYSCTLLYISSRRFFAKPAEATAAYFPDSAPKVRETIQKMTNARPIFRMYCMLPASIPKSMRFAINMGMITSKMTSQVTNSGASKELVLYSLTLRSNFLTIPKPPFCSKAYWVLNIKFPFLFLPYYAPVFSKEAAVYPFLLL